jgi:hypothetical protein
MLRFAANSPHEEAKFKIVTQLVPHSTGLSNRSDIGVAAIPPLGDDRNPPNNLSKPLGTTSHSQRVSLPLNPDAL